MNLKILLGVIVPLIAITILVVLSNINTGFSIQKENEKEIDYSKLFTSQNQAGEIKLQTISIKNDYFLPKKIELPTIAACLYDKENKTRGQNLYVRYNEGKSSDIPETPIAGGLLQTRNSYYGYGYYTATRTVDVPANSQKEVKLMVQPKYVYNNYDAANNNADYEYDEILIIEPKEDKNNYNYYSYDSCANLQEKDVDDAVKIPISNRPTANQIKSVECADSDGGTNYYVKGTVTVSGQSVTDFCWNYRDNYGPCEGNMSGCVLVEHYCAGNQIGKTQYNCPNGCKDGACV